MSLSAACAWSFVRAVLIAAVAMPIAVFLCRMLRNQLAGSTRWLLMAMLLVPFLMPELLIGFVYRETTLQIVNELSGADAVVAPPTQVRLPQSMDRPLNSADVLAELLYAALLLCRFVPVAALTLWFMPAPRLSAEAIHCQKLLLATEPSWFKRLCGQIDCFARGPLMGILPAFAIVFLLVFQEFEIASLMQISRAPISWTVWLFDGNAGGVMIGELVRNSIVPVLCEVVMIAAVFGLVLRGDWNETTKLARQESAGGSARGFSWVFLVGAVFLAVGLPLCRISSGALAGMKVLAAQPKMRDTLLSELGVSLAFGLATALTAYWLTGLLLESRFRRSLSLVLSMPGLIGSLVMGLVALELFQKSALNFAYDTPIPMLLVLSLFLIPRAALLRLVFFARQPQEPVFIAESMSRSRDARLRVSGFDLMWPLRKRPAFWTVALLTYWGYWDLTVAAILKPMQLEPFTPRLYNLMHYGRNETLAAMSLIAAVAPVILVGVAAVSLKGFRNFRAARMGA